MLTIVGSASSCPISSILGHNDPFVTSKNFGCESTSLGGLLSYLALIGSQTARE
jgi:hypothetical protein